VICEQWEVVTVPFPFADRAETKRRPALVLSCEVFNRQGNTILAMITTSVSGGRRGDWPIRFAAEAGLRPGSLIRLKLFTLDNRLILRRLGQLAPGDAGAVRTNLREALGELV